MGDGWGGLLIGLGILFTIGFIVPLVVSPFVPTGSYNQNSFINPIRDFVSNNVIFNIMPNFQDFMVSQLNAFSYIPNIIAIPLLIISLVMIVYSFIPLV